MDASLDVFLSFISGSTSALLLYLKRLQFKVCIYIRWRPTPRIQNSCPLGRKGRNPLITGMGYHAVYFIFPNKEQRRSRICQENTTRGFDNRNLIADNHS